MADPVYVNSSNAGFSSAITSHTVSYTGFTVAANDLFVLNIICNSASATITMPSSWTQLFSYDIDGSGTSGKHEVWYKGAAGASTASEAWTTSSAASGAHTLTQYRDALLDVATTPARVRGTNALPNPPGFGLVDISPGVTDMTIALAAWDSNAAIATYPSGYSTGQQEASSSTSRVASVSKGTTGGDNPGVYSIGAPSDWSAATVLIRYDAGGQPAVADPDVDIELETITSDCEFLDFTPLSTFVELPTITSNLTPQDTQFEFLANLETIQAVADFSDGWTFLSNPVFLETITANAEFRDATSFIATNADLPTITADADFKNLDTQQTVELPTITADLTYQTQLEGYRLARNRIKKIDMSQALFDLQVLPPEGLVEGDIFGYVIIASSVSGRVISTGFTSYPTLANLANKGDRVMWRYIAGEYYVWNLIDG